MCVSPVNKDDAESVNNIKKSTDDETRLRLRLRLPTQSLHKKRNMARMGG